MPYVGKARLLFSDKMLFDDGALYQIVVWAVPRPVPPARHGYKYSLFYGYPGQRIVGYDNERGKGDHRHVMGDELPYAFTTLDRLIDDFAADVLRVTGRRL